MNDITALAQRLGALMQEDSVPMSDSWGRLFDALQAGDTENERMARDLISRNGEIEGLRKRVEELEEIATDYGMKFQRAQDGLKKMVLMHRDESRTVTVKLPKPHAHLIWIQAGHAPDDYWDDVAVSHSEKDRCCDGSERYPVYAQWEIKEMLATAGIQVIEGEGQ